MAPQPVCRAEQGDLYDQKPPERDGQVRDAVVRAIGTACDCSPDFDVSSEVARVFGGQCVAATSAETAELWMLWVDRGSIQADDRRTGRHQYFNTRMARCRQSKPVSLLFLT